MHSLMFSLVQSWRQSSPDVWNDAMLKTAVEIGWINTDEFKEISGNDYVA